MLIMAIFILVLLAVLMTFGLLIAFLTPIFRQSGGWNRLAASYMAQGQPEGEVYTKQTVQIGAVRYRQCTTVYVGPRGLYLSVHVSVLPSSPPLFIPWGEFKHVQETLLYWQRAFRLTIGDPQVGTLTLKAGLFAMVQPYLAIDS
jgi:hypothetical protein